MDGFKDFQGKNLDDAISAACEYFDAPRERLEIDILQDAKTGIFGIVGARKAKIRARRVQWRNTIETVFGQGAARKSEGSASLAGSVPAPVPLEKERSGNTADTSLSASTAEESAFPVEKAQETAVSSLEGAESGEERRPSRDRRQRSLRPRREENGDGRISSRKERRFQREGTLSAGGEEAPSLTVSTGEEAFSLRRRRGRSRTLRAPLSPIQETVSSLASGHDEEDGFSEGFQEVPFEELDQERLQSLTVDVIARLVAPIAGTIPLRVSLGDKRVHVAMDCSADSGLLIGREGQTLAALQYLTSRIVSQSMGVAVRVQLDAGEYRLRQDEKLRDMALALAEKVRATGKPCSTRPLSSYHRRIIHMTLQAAEDVQTRSSGDGPLKRVVVLRRKH